MSYLLTISVNLLCRDKGALVGRLNDMHREHHSSEREPAENMSSINLPSIPREFIGIDASDEHINTSEIVTEDLVERRPSRRGTLGKAQSLDTDGLPQKPPTLLQPPGLR